MTWGETNIALEFAHFEWEIHLQSGSIFHCHVSLPECSNRFMDDSLPKTTLK